MLKPIFMFAEHAMHGGWQLPILILVYIQLLNRMNTQKHGKEEKLSIKKTSSELLVNLQFEKVWKDERC